MNENVCRLCRRYAGRPKSVSIRGWLCAKLIEIRRSDVVPGFSYFWRDMLHPILPDRKEIPEWCERPLEQVILRDGEKCEARPDEDRGLKYDGNKAAEERKEWKFSKGW